MHVLCVHMCYVCICVMCACVRAHSCVVYGYNGVHTGMHLMLQSNDSIQ